MLVSADVSLMTCVVMVVIVLHGDRVHLRQVALLILRWALSRDRRSRLLLWVLLRRLSLLLRLLLRLWLRLLLRRRLLLLQRFTRSRAYTVVSQYLIDVPEIQLSHAVLCVTRGNGLIKVLLECLRRRRLLVMVS